MALRAPAVEVDGDIWTGEGRGQWTQSGGVDDAVHRAGQPHERGQPGRRGQHHPMVGEGIVHAAEGGNGGEEVAQAQGSEDEDHRHRRRAPPAHRLTGSPAHGQEDSVDGQTSSSRISHPGGWRRANTTVAATSSGRLSLASAGGR